MPSYLVNAVIIWAVLLLILALLFAIGVLIYFNLYGKRSDKILLIDRNNRWRILDIKYTGQTEWEHDKRKYFLVPDSSILSRNGKALYIFSENKPAPMRLKYNSSEWLDSTSIKAMLNNDLIQKMLETKNPSLEIMMIIGAFASIVAGLCSVVILLKMFGVIK